MVVTFCGHRQVFHQDAVRQWLSCVVGELIEKGAATFYVGGHGEFDNMVASVLREKKKVNPRIDLVHVVAYLPTEGDSLGYDGTVYPPLENVPKRFAITHRNRWMVDASDVVVGYVLHDGGGAAATLKYAKQKKKEIVSFHP